MTRWILKAKNSQRRPWKLLRIWFPETTNQNEDSIRRSFSWLHCFSHLRSWSMVVECYRENNRSWYLQGPASFGLFSSSDGIPLRDIHVTVWRNSSYSTFTAVIVEGNTDRTGIFSFLEHEGYV